MDNTGIEWCDHTFNPWIGCTKVSPACDNCYAERDMSTRLHIVQWGAGQPRQRTGEKNWNWPGRWNRQHDKFYAEHGRRQRVFCASLADVFDNEIDVQWRVDLFRKILETPNLDWLLLTKRIGNVEKMVAEVMAILRPGEPVRMPANVWLGATIPNQTEADRDVVKLLEAKQALQITVAFLSMEPLLGPVVIRKFMWPVHGWWTGPHKSYAEAKAAGAECGLKRQALVWAGCAFIDWVIAGGESGPQARPMHPDWIRSLRDQCEPAGVPFLFKQWGEWMPAELKGDNITTSFPVGQPTGPKTPAFHTWPDGSVSARVGKKAAGRLLDGKLHDGYPAIKEVAA